jgi:hypothetical protein
MSAGRGIPATAWLVIRGAIVIGAAVAIVATSPLAAPSVATSCAGCASAASETTDRDDPTEVCWPRSIASWLRAAPSKFRDVTPSQNEVLDWFGLGDATGSMKSATDWLNLALHFIGVLVGFAFVAFTFLWWPVRRIRRPRVAVKPLTVPDSMALSGQHLAGLLSTELSSTTSGPNLRRVSDAAAETGVDLARGAGPSSAWLAPILAKLSLRKVLVVCGDAWGVAPTADSEDERKTEATLTVSVTDHQGRVASRSFSARQCDISIADLLQAQVPLAGAWLTDRLQRSRATKEGRRTAWFGTTEWWSWGTFRQGVWYEDHDRPDIAEICYREAITADVRNAAAWLNLAELKLVETNERDEMTDAISLVRMADIVNHNPPTWLRRPPWFRRRRGATNRLDPVGNTGVARHELPVSAAKEDDPLWYRVRTVEIVALLNRAASKDRLSPEASQDRDRAQALARQLVSELARKQQKLEHRLWGRGRRRRLDDLHQLLDATEDYTVALLAGSTWRPDSYPTADPLPTGNRPQSLKTLANIPDDRPPSRQTLWTRRGSGCDEQPGAAGGSRASRPSRPQPHAVDDVLRLLAGLRTDPRVIPSEGHAQRLWRRICPRPPGESSTAKSSAVSAEWPHHAISSQAHYNLACLYAQASTEEKPLADTALKHLKHASDVSRSDVPKFAKRAKKDPDLEPLWTDTATSEEFEEILAGRAPQRDTPAPK